MAHSSIGRLHVSSDHMWTEFVCSFVHDLMFGLVFFSARAIRLLVARKRSNALSLSRSLQQQKTSRTQNIECLWWCSDIHVQVYVPANQSTKTDYYFQVAIKSTTSIFFCCFRIETDFVPFNRTFEDNAIDLMHHSQVARVEYISRFHWMLQQVICVWKVLRSRMVDANLQSI